MTANIQKEKPDLNKKVHELPHKPGVYLMRDRFNRVIYVGKARDLRKRVGQYFIPSRAMRADMKTRALLESVWNFEVHTVKSEPEALLLEGRLIKEFRPRYNVSFRDDKRFLLVKVEIQDSWPRFRLTRLRREDGARYFGPFAHSGALRQTMNFMRKKFGVLTFGRGSPTERELKSSTYQVPMKLSDTNAEQYRDRVEAACEFLSGKSQEFIAQLEAEMHEAAKKLEFEKAAELRNMLDDLRKTTKPMRRFTRQDLPKTIDPAADLVTLQEALKLPVPPLVIECFDISNISTTHIVASMVCFKNGVPDKNSYRRYRIKTVKGQNDFASMAEVVRRRYSRVLAETGKSKSAEAEVLPTSGLRSLPSGETSLDYSESQETPLEIAQRLQEIGGEFQFPAIRIPDLIILDGGQGQLSAACKELQRLGLFDIPVMGLAKEFEEIYRPGRPMPQRLPEGSGALYLLQRIRDEAHRFANSFHQLLMKRRIAESLLDDCPGVSQTRKQSLLRKFGSVTRIRAASAEEIARIDGIGPKLAEQIRDFLQKMQ